MSPKSNRVTECNRDTRIYIRNILMLMILIIFSCIVVLPLIVFIYTPRKQCLGSKRAKQDRLCEPRQGSQWRLTPQPDTMNMHFFKYKYWLSLLVSCLLQVLRSSRARGAHPEARLLSSATPHNLLRRIVKFSVIVNYVMLISFLLILTQLRMIFGFPRAKHSIQTLYGWAGVSVSEHC